jgi:hypothetical protein
MSEGVRLRFAESFRSFGAISLRWFTEP